MAIPRKLFPNCFAFAIVAFVVCGESSAQAISRTTAIPEAPASRLLAEVVTQSPSPNQAAAQTPSCAPSAGANGKSQLTRQQAEQMATKNNPQVSVARLLALAQHQMYRETRSAELPTASAAITA